MSDEIQKLLYSIKEAAAAVSLSPRTLYNDISLVRRGEKADYLIRPRFRGRRVLYHIDDLRAFANSLSLEPEVQYNHRPKKVGE